MSLKLLKNKDWDKINKSFIDDQEEENYIKLERWSIQNEDKPVIYTKVEDNCINYLCLYFNRKTKKCMNKKTMEQCKKINQDFNLNLKINE